MSLERGSRVSSLLVVTLLASACGGGGGGGGGPDLAETGVGGSGGVTGPVQGFGSIIVNDLVLDVDDAEFEIEGAAAGIGESGQNRLAEGQQLRIRADLRALDAEQVVYRSDVKGPLEAAPTFDPLTGVGRMTVLGQTVRVNAATRYDGGADLETLQQGALLEISGERNASGELVATYVGLESGLTEYKVVGRADAVDAGGFRIGALEVDVLTNGLAPPAAGARVEVRLPLVDPAPASAVPATAIELLDGLELEAGERYEILGFVDQFSSRSSLRVGGIPVSVPAGAAFEDGDAGDLELDARVEVEGTADDAGRLIAERVIFRSSDAIRVEATVTGVDLQAGTVTTSVGLTFVVRELTELEDDSAAGVEPFTLDDLMSGDFIEARGFRDGGELVAAEIEREDFAPDEPTVLRAPADGAPSVAGGELELSLLGVSVRGAAGITGFESDEDADIGLQAFAELVDRGVVVEVRWDAFSATSATADAMAIEEEDDD